MPARRPVLSGVLTLLALAAWSCDDFRVPGPEDPAPVDLPRTVAVTIQYRQPNGCLNTAARCDDPVVFFASWMRPGAEFRLTPDAAGTFFWTGTAYGVPVNFPPRDAPYQVRIFDPYLQDAPGATRYTAQRLIVGGQSVTRIEKPSLFDEFGLIYIDDNGQGHNPF